MRGPNIEKLDSQFLPTMEVGVGPNTEADEKSAYNNVQVGDGPQHSEIGFPISTDNASWRGPNTEAGGKSAYNNVQVGGAPTLRISK